MPRSMTGFGRSECVDGASRIVCEIKSVNHRFLSVRFRLPPFLTRHEALVESRIRRVAKRGAFEVFVQYDARGEQAAAEFDAAVATRYWGQLERWRKGAAPAEPVSIDALLSLPGVVVPPDPGRIAARIGSTLRESVDGALDQLVGMREREGRRLAKVLEREAKVLERAAASLRKSVPRLVKEQHRRLRERVAKLEPAGGWSEAEPALARELALLADRTDVTEELDRIHSHVAEFRRWLEAQGSIGRSLEFVVQELGREFNTVGSKTQNARIAARVITAKAAVERLREQVQNVE